MTPTSGIAVGRGTGIAVLAGGLIGLIASLTLTIERIELLKNPSYVPSCSINPVLSCGSVMVTPQAALLGFPNPILGLIAFTIVVVTGVLALARVTLPRWYWLSLAAGLLVGVVFVNWLVFQSLYRIGALCPYCMVVWAVTIPLFVIALTAALFTDQLHPILKSLFYWRWSLVALWFTAVVLAILERFWDYWSSLI
ncbi:MAG: vitamin K epoxide reductase family protein [Mycobacteriaceae bacterium]